MKKNILFILIKITLLSTNVNAAKYYAGEDVNIITQVDDDVYITANEINIQAVINGDLIGRARKIYINNTIQSDILLFADEITINGPVFDDVRFIGRTIKISNEIRGDLIVFASNILIDKNAIIHGDLIVYGGNVILEGIVEGHVTIRCSKATVNGKIRGALKLQAGQKASINGNIIGNSILAAGSFVLGPKAKFDDTIRYWQKQGGLDFRPFQTKGKSIYDPSLSINSINWESIGISFFSFYIFSTLAGIIVMLLIFFLLSPVLIDAAVYIRKYPWTSLGVGFLYFIFLPLIIFFLAVIIIGIPLSLFLLMIYIFSIIFGPPLCTFVIASFLLKKRISGINKRLLLVLSIGIFILLEFILLIPLLGTTIVFLLLCFTYGALIQEAIEGRRTRRIITEINML